MENESIKYGKKTVLGIQCVNYFCRLLKSLGNNELVPK